MSLLTYNPYMADFSVVFSFTLQCIAVLFVVSLVLLFVILVFGQLVFYPPVSFDLQEHVS